MIFLFVQPDVSAAAAGAQQIGGVIIPQAFSQALQDGMSVPLYIHLAGSQSTRDDQRIGSAFIWLDGGQLRVRQIQLEESEGNASVSEQTRQQLIGLANAPFSEALTIPLTDSAQLDLSLRQLLLQLVVKREALGTVLRSRSEDIGQSSVNTLSSNLSYNLGVYNNQMRNGGSNTSSYLSLNNVTALRSITWCSTARCTASAAVSRTVNYIRPCMSAISPATALPAGCLTPGTCSPWDR